MILVITSKDDLTSDYLIRRVVERGLPLFRFNTEDLLTTYDVSISVTNAGARFTLWDRVRETQLDSGDVVGAYFRRPQRPLEPQDFAADERAFSERELLETLRSLWRIIPKERWLNSPENLFLANNKVKQLTVANEIGFRIPETLISSRPADVLRFAERHGNDLVAKSVKNGVLVSDKKVSFVFTSIVESADYAELEGRETIIPSTFQPRLEKECDVRVTVVGDSVFPVAILSQSHALTSVDWRTWDTVADVDLVQRAFSLPKEITEMCLELNRRLRLNFSCIDLVLTKEGDFYFLEINPNGQWAWVEEIGHFSVRDAIIDRLARKEEA